MFHFVCTTYNFTINVVYHETRFRHIFSVFYPPPPFFRYIRLQFCFVSVNKCILQSFSFVFSIFNVIILYFIGTLLQVVIMFLNLVDLSYYFYWILPSYIVHNCTYSVSVMCVIVILNLVNIFSNKFSLIETDYFSSTWCLYQLFLEYMSLFYWIL